MHNRIYYTLVSWMRFFIAVKVGLGFQIASHVGSCLNSWTDMFSNANNTHISLDVSFLMGLTLCASPAALRWNPCFCFVCGTAVLGEIAGKPFCWVVILTRENMCCTDFARFHAWLKLCRAYALFLKPLPEQAPLPPWLIAGRHSRGDLASINRHEGNSPASNINTETGCAATEARPELVRAPQALRAPQRRLFNTQILLEEIWPRISMDCLICHEPRPGFTWSGQILKLMSDSNEGQLSQSRISVLYVRFHIHTLCLVKPHRGPSNSVCVFLWILATCYMKDCL